MRVNIRAILADPRQRKELMVRVGVALQARAGIETTPAQMGAAYDAVRGGGEQGMKAYFQHPDTGESCWATYAGKVLTAKTERGEEVLRRPAATVAEAQRELIRFGVDANEARFEA